LPRALDEIIDAAASGSREARALGETVEAADTDAAAAEEETCEEACTPTTEKEKCAALPFGACDSLVDLAPGSGCTFAGLALGAHWVATTADAGALGETLGAADTDAAAEEETCVEARALGSPVEAADTDAAAAEEETCGKARALGSPVEVADTDAAAEEETCTFGKAGAGSRGETVELAIDAPET